MIRQALRTDRDLFQHLWAEFLRDAHKAGADMLPTQRNLKTMMGIFDLYMAGEMDGVALIAEKDGKPAGVNLTGEAARSQMFDSEFGRVATGWGTYVREAHRGEGWSRQLREASMRYAGKMGFDVIVGPIAFTNEASLESCRSLGVETPSVVAVMRLGG